MANESNLSDLNAANTAQGERLTALGQERVHNELGIIAETYHDLQGLGILHDVRKAHPLPKASAESLIRALLQATEIALLNLNDVVARAAADLEGDVVDGAVVKMFWARGFHRLLTGLSQLPGQLSGSIFTGPVKGTLRISDSPAFNSYLASLKELDAQVRRLIDSGLLDAHAAIADRSLDDAKFNFLHLLRICNHESTIWEANLSEVAIAVEVPSLAAFVVSDEMHHTVYERVLKRDTYFTQFRGLHQIPETLGEEANDWCEEAILDIRAGRLERGLERLRSVVTLMEAMISSLPPMADNLATSDYHQIRENLGLTSGSHSVCLRYHMFTDLYEQLAHELVVQLTGRSADEVSDEQIIAAVSRIDRERSGNRRAWLIHLMVNECMRMQSCIFLWRGEHLHMPRNNLGGNHTKSLTGSPDAIKAVWQMYGAAKAKDPMSPIARARGLPSGRHSIPAGPLTRYLSSDESLDRAVLAKTGEITQGRFQSVQERLGFFAGRCPFTAPPRRMPENMPVAGRTMSADRADSGNPDRRIASQEQQDDWGE